MLFWGSFENFFVTYLNSTHPDVKEWPLVDTTTKNFYIIFCYLAFVLYLGPTFMKDRRPFDLRRIMVPYNIALVIFNFYLFWHFTRLGFFGKSGAACSPLKLKDSPEAFNLAEVTWWFYITKYIELCDTVFFVLRKKENQLSKLHLIHHSSVPILCWGLLRWEPGGYNTFFPLANSFVHCVMYTYYGISALGDDVKIHLWFKKYVTMTQMIQFILVLSYFISRPFMGCPVSYLSWLGNMFLSGFFFVLFCNFYWHAYCLSSKQGESEAPNTKLSNGTRKED